MKSIHLLATALWLGLGLSLPTLAAHPIGQVPDSYAGLSKDKLGLIDCSKAILTQGVFYYRRLYGEWPRSWAEVRASGLVTVDLKTPSGTVIDPDDKTMDLDFDLRYQYLGPDTPPRLIRYHSMISPAMKISDFPRGKTFAEHFVSARKRSIPLPRGHTDRTWLKKFAIGCMMNKLLELHFYSNGREDVSWEEFAAGEFFPLTDRTGSDHFMVPSTGTNTPTQVGLIDPITGERIQLGM